MLYVSAIQLKMCDIYFKIWHDIYIFIYLKPAENRRPYVSYFFNAFSYGCHSFIKNCFYTSNLFDEKNEHYYLCSRNYIFSVGAAIFSINWEIFALCWKISIEKFCLLSENINPKTTIYTSDRSTKSKLHIVWG